MGIISVPYTGSVISTGSTTSRTLADRFADYANVKDFGAKGDGTTDDTSSFNAALVANKNVFVPTGKYVLSNVIMNPGNSLFGFSAVGAAYPGNTASVAATTPNTPSLVAKSGASRILNIDNANSYSINGLLIDGVTGSANGIEQPTFGSKSYGTIRDCVIINCNVGVNANYGTVHASESSFGNCVNGINNIVDSRISGCDFAGNSHYGLNLGAGASSMNITGCRFEWNGWGGINIGDGTATGLSNRIVITGNWFDRNGWSGVLITPGSDVTITGNTFMRNGSTDVSLWGQSHIYCFGAVRVSISGNTTSIGANDDGSGTVTPRYCVAFDAPPGGGISIVGNNLTGCTVASTTGTPPADLTTTGTAHVTSGSAVITSLSSTTTAFKGMRLTGAGIPIGNTIASVDSSTQVTCALNNTATATTVAVTFKGDYVKANNVE